MKAKESRFKRLKYLFIGLFLSLSFVSAPVNTFADERPDEDLATTETEQQTETQNETETQTGSTENACWDQSGAIGWLICPTTGVVSNAVDGIYDIIEDLLIIKPVSFDEKAPIRLVWEYVRGITNVVFIILILVVVYSQITGIGLSNYSIKRVLPKIVVCAILINLSFIICAALVDVSNIIGANLRAFFSHVEELIIENGTISSTVKISWADLTGAIFLGGTLGAVSIIASPGLLWMLIPVVLGAIISIVAGLITISLRQAVVSLLVMVAPLAFVCYLLPNTEKWFALWKKTLSQMLIFYPIFAALFGASQLVGWVIIASAENAVGIILGMAVQVFPLFFSVSLMKMSGTVLGTVSGALMKLGSGAKNSASRFAISQRDYARAKNLAENTGRFSVFNPSSWRAGIAMHNASKESDLKLLQEGAAIRTQDMIVARRQGRRIIGYRNDGSPIYSTRPVNARLVEASYQNRVLKLGSDARALEYENNMNDVAHYLEENGAYSGNIINLSNTQSTNYQELRTQQSAKLRNDRAMNRFYLDSIRRASERDAVSGEIIDRATYDRLITRGAGSDAYSDDEKTRNDATTSVIADAYDAFENDRKVTTAKYTTYLRKQVSKEVDRVYDEMLKVKNIDGIVAAQSVTAERGDYDKISKQLSEYMDQDHYVKLGSDFANVLATSLLGLKDADTELGRLGKHINVETWRYTNGNRDSDFVTMKEYYTGKDSNGETTKFNITNLLQGTGLKGIDRTAFDGLKLHMDQYFTAENFGGNAAAARDARNQVMNSMMPQIISAVPSFASGSEQIISTMKFMTGLTTRPDGSWGQKLDSNGNPVETPEEAANSLKYTEDYLRFLTPNDLINFKSDAFAAVRARLVVAYGSEAAARTQMQNLCRNNIEVLRAGDRSALTPMKQSVRTYLGL